MEKAPTRTKNGKKLNKLTLSSVAKTKSKSSLIGVEDYPVWS